LAAVLLALPGFARAAPLLEKQSLFEARSSAGKEQPVEEIVKASGIKGGLVVQLGCRGGNLLTIPRADGSTIVQGLDTDARNVEKARARIQSLELGGKVSALEFDGRHLPYADNLVNLIVAEDLGQVAIFEVMRVLCPGGVAYIRQKATWSKAVKPWPAGIDQWTHALHGPDNNAVAEDSVVGPPRRVQWISGPRFSRSHDHLASVSVAVSADGRLFSIIDEGSIAFAAARSRWRLVAQDAFNGVRLWEREIPSWEYHLRDFRSGPAEIGRRLVAVGDRVYVTLGYGQPVSALNAVTGETVRTYAGTEGAEEILHGGGKLFLVLAEREKDWPAQEAKEIVSQKDYTPPFERYVPPSWNKRVMAVDADSGQPAWRSSEPYTQNLMPSTLAVSAGRVYFQNADAVVCLDAGTGRLRWQTPRPVQRTRLAWSTPTLVVHDGIVYSADRGATDKAGKFFWLPSGGYHQYLQREDAKGELIAFSGETGKRLWSCPAYEGFNVPVDVMIAGGLLWTGRFTWGNDPGIIEGRDPKTGEVRRTRPRDQEFMRGIGHARCHRVKATEKFLIMGRKGVEFVDLRTGAMVADAWVRGICQYGFVPANGLLYVPPHSCACNTNELLKCGFMALAPEPKAEDREPKTESGKPKAEEPPRLQRGPAFSPIPSPQSPVPSPTDWPTYRHDPARSGALPEDVACDLHIAWETELGGQLTSPVIAGGVLLVSESDAHRVHALETATGRRLWTYVAGARIDSPPTIDRGRAVFGSADGWVYCLRLADGEVIWRFRAAPQDRQIVADGQLESAWPVSGSVLVVDGAVFFVAGRSSHLDDGLLFYKLDAATGRTLGVQRLDGAQRGSPDPAEQKQNKGKRGIASAGCLPDVLSALGDSIFMRAARFDRELVRQKDDVAHLWSSVGFLDDSWWHRTYWQFGTFMGSGWGNWPKAGQQVPAGRLLVIDGSRVFGFGRNQYDIPGAHVGVDAAEVWGPIGKEQGRWTFYRLFAQTLDARPADASHRSPKSPTANRPDWTYRIPVLARAMVLAGQTLFVAGPADKLSEAPYSPTTVDPLSESLEATRGGRLLVVSATDGKPLADLELPSPPVFDGMAAAQGRLYVSTKIGRVLCLAPVR